VIIIIIKKEFTYRSSDQQLIDIFEDGNTVPHDNVYNRKTNLIKMLEIKEIQQLLNYTKELYIPRKECNAICFLEECRKKLNFC